MPGRLAVSKEKYFELVGYKPHEKQWLFHDSKARFKIPVCGRRYGKTIMGAREAEPILMVPNKRVWICGPCVDEETEILTQRGWLKYNEVQVGDKTLSINPINGFGEWDEVSKVLINPGVHDMIRMEGHSFSALATPDHRWLTQRRTGIGYRKEGSKLPKVLKPIEHLLPKTANGWTWRTTTTLTADDRIPKAALSTDLPTEAKYTDEFVELVAWLWTEGSQNKRGGLNIHQSWFANPSNVERIRRAITVMCPNPTLSHSSVQPGTEYWSENVAPSSIEKTTFYLGKVIASEFRKVFLSHKVVDPEFILSLTLAQLKLFVDVSVLGDGTVGKGDTDGYAHQQKVIYQDNEEQLFAVQLACQLLGIPTSIRLRTKDGENGWVLGILNSKFVNPKRAVYVAGPEGMKITEEIYAGNTWCVTTKNGNWLAKRSGTVYYTSNTYDLGEKEFRVIWQDMIVKLGLGKEKTVKRAFNKRSGDMYIEFPWNTRLEVRSADRPETLVGDALDYVIMAEAAKHNKETWDRYIRPALADRRGSATFSTTPEGQNWIHDLWQLGRNPLFEDYESWRFPSWDNPHIYPDGRNDKEILLLERTMPFEWFQQEIAADFTSFMGRIYSEFDEVTHVKPHRYNPAFKNYICFDWGYVNPMAAVEFQVDSMDRIHVWRLHYKTHTRLETFLDQMRAREQPQGYKIDLCFGDAADPEATATVCAKFAPCISKPESKTNWREGIDLVKSFLSTRTVGYEDEFETPQEEPWLFVDPTCGDLIREFNNYRAAAPSTGKNNRNPREDAQKYDDHALDALRYGLMHIFKLGCTMSLADIYGNLEMKDLPDTGYFTSNMEFA